MLALFLIIAFIIYVQYANDLIKNLKAENKKLKEQLQLKNTNTDMTIKMEKTKNVEQKVNPPVVENKVLSEEEKQKLKLEKEQKEREKKNTSILLTGAVLIVLSAIVFLMSTWNTIPNILKTSVLVLLIGVFLGGSFIAKEKFALEKTSRTFFYIAMAYIPICLFSISIFGLLGEYLSIRGEGRYVYLTGMGILTATIYWMMYRKQKNLLLFYGSILVQVFSVILFSLVLSNKIEIMICNILLYNIVLMLLLSKEKYLGIDYVYKVIPYCMAVGILPFLQTYNFWILSNIFILAINFLMLTIKENKMLHAVFLNICIQYLGIYSIWNSGIFEDTSFQISLTTLYFVMVYIIENLLLLGQNKRNLKVANAIVTFCFLQILYWDIFDSKVSFIRPYILTIIQLCILVISYKKTKTFGKNILNLAIPIYFIITGITFLNDLHFSYPYYIIFAFITFIVGELLRLLEMKDLQQRFFQISHIFLALTFVVVSLIEGVVDFITGRQLTIGILYWMFLLIVYIYSYYQKKQPIWKYLAYITTYITLITASIFFKIPEKFIYVIPALTTIGLTIFENQYTGLKDNFGRIFFSICKIISYIFLIELTNKTGAILSIFVTVYFIYDNTKNHRNVLENVIPLIGVMPSIFDNYLAGTLEIGTMLLSTIALTAFSLRNKKINVYTIFSAIYLLLTVNEIDTQYLNQILWILWAFCNWYLIEIPKEKDICKTILLVGILSLYNVCIDELGLDTYTAFCMLGYIAFAIVLIRNILKKYISRQNIDVIEALTFILMYVVAFSKYTNEQDGMLFVLVLICVVMFSYVKKYGTLFLVTIATILINGILLTRVFWLSIPWWVYLLVIGSILISFAIRNEASEKNKQFHITDTLKSIKDKIEK